jgi:hypothetical protein
MGIYFYMVVSYDPTENTARGAKVLVNGIYENKELALCRQKELCGGNTCSTLCGNNSVVGANGRISWIKQIPLGDFTFDVKVPDMR